jgi:hypothetical protein
MKNLNSEIYGNIFDKFILSNEEMICVRGGDAEDDPKIVTPPIVP